MSKFILINTIIILIRWKNSKRSCTQFTIYPCFLSKTKPKYDGLRDIRIVTKVLSSQPQNKVQYAYSIRKRSKIQKKNLTTVNSLIKSNGSSVSIGPAITGSVTSTAPEVNLGKEKGVVWHLTMTEGRYPSSSPIPRHTQSLVYEISPMVTADCLFAMVWEKNKVTIWACIAVTELNLPIVRLKSLFISLSRSSCW